MRHRWLTDRATYDETYALISQHAHESIWLAEVELGAERPQTLISPTFIQILFHIVEKMRFICLATALATACAFTSQPAAFTTSSPSVGGRAFDDVVAPSTSHRNRKATIVMDGKANGEFT
jgi:hypothetical protein